MDRPARIVAGEEQDMTNTELDTMWFQAQHDAIKAGEDFTRYRFAALVAATQREKVAHWMRNCGYATGHGDTIEDLLAHLGTQIAEGLEVEAITQRAACAQIARQFDRDHPNTNYGGCIARLIEGATP
jgi:O-methyltransferase involved in polyketide biosynthesis